MNILITGTSSGIGQGLAMEYLSRGASVWGLSRRELAVMAGKKNYHHLQIDITDYDLLKKQLPEFIKDVKSFDLVILNAGVLGPIRFATDVGLEEMKMVMEINVWANKVLLDLLFSRDIDIKQVTGMSSKASLRSTPGWGSYSMSKAGLNMLMNVYAKEHSDIHFSAFAPGLVDSEIQEQIWQIKEREKYPAAARLQDARYSDEMPDASKAASVLIEGFEKALQYESGSFVDVREM
jgi:NAD(P)-dependent dehydrogenase (short-subunit alcohol dehydrogenase family)